MKLVIKRNELSNMLSSLIQIIPSKSAEPLFSDFSIKCENDLLTIIASDGIISMKIEQKLQDEEGHEIILNMEDGHILTRAKDLYEIISKCEGDIISFNLVDDNYLRITDDISEFKVVVRDGREYPDINLNVEENNSSFKVKIEDFRKLYDKTSYAVAIKGPRELYYGINVNFKDNKLSFLATDTYRMAKYTVEAEGSDEIIFTSPTKALSLIKDLEEKGEVEVFCDKKSALFVTNKGIISTRLILGDFPLAERVIPQVTPYSIEVKTNEFSRIVERMSILSSNDGKNCQVKLTINEDRKVILSGESITYGNSNEEVRNAKVKMPENEKVFEIGFNSNYVLSAIKSQESENVIFVFASAIKAFLIKSEDENNLQIITPMRLNNY